MKKSDCPTGCKDDNIILLSLYIEKTANINYDTLQHILETQFGYSASRTSTAIKFMHMYGKCLIYEDTHTNVIEKAQILANNNIQHSIKNEQIFK